MWLIYRKRAESAGLTPRKITWTSIVPASRRRVSQTGKKTNLRNGRPSRRYALLNARFYRGGMTNSNSLWGRERISDAASILH